MLDIVSNVLDVLHIASRCLEMGARMRTTLTLDDDIVARLEEERRRTGLSLKEIVNHMLRCGLEATVTQPESEPFLVEARPMGLVLGLNYANTAELLEQIEGPYHR